MSSNYVFQPRFAIRDSRFALRAATRLNTALGGAMKHSTETCPRCGHTFEFSEDHRLVRSNNYSAPIIGMRALVRYLDVFMITCPKCGEAFSSKNVKLLGLFTITNAWVVPALLIMLFAIFVLTA